MRSHGHAGAGAEVVIRNRPSEKQRTGIIPVVLGLSFEVLQLTNKVRHVPLLRFLGYPGLWLQLLTTKEPKDDQVEVAIASFKELLRVENELSSTTDEQVV